MMSAFTRLRLRNFKSWRDTGSIRLAPITAFFGANSSGKTSLLQSLLLLRQTTDSPDRSSVLDLGGGPNSQVDLGTARDIQYGHDDRNDIGIDVNWTAPKPVEIRENRSTSRAVLLSSDEMSLRTTLEISSSFVSVRETEYGIGDACFRMTRRSKRNEYDLTGDGYNFLRVPGRRWPLPPPTRFYGFPDQVRAYFENAGFLSDLELEFEKACARIHYLGPLREVPLRQYTFSGAVRTDVGRKGESAVGALVAARQADVRVHRGFYVTKAGVRKRLQKVTVEHLVAQWLLELGLIESFDVEAVDDRRTLYRVMVRRSRSSLPVLLTDVGFGVSQVLPILVLLACASEGDTVILEQPEIHLHPAVQSGLADVIIEAALARDVQVILESHSEHLLSRLQRRIAEYHLDRGLTLDPEDVALYFCRLQDGQSRIEELDVDIFGEISNWPTDFFGDPLGDAVAMMEAAAAREGEGSH